MNHSHALNPSSTSTHPAARSAVAALGAALIAYRINRRPAQRSQLLHLAQLAASLGAISTNDWATLNATLRSQPHVTKAVQHG